MKPPVTYTVLNYSGRAVAMVQAVGRVEGRLFGDGITQSMPRNPTNAWGMSGFAAEMKGYGAGSTRSTRPTTTFLVAYVSHMSFSKAEIIVLFAST